MQSQEPEIKKMKDEVKEKVKTVSPVEEIKKAEELVPKESLEKKEKISKDILGDINIPTEVLSAIVTRIVNNISGVVGLFTHSKSGFGTLLGVKELEEGIKVELVGGKSVSTYISVIVDYGSVIIDLAKKIQTVVKNEVEEKTGLLVKSVDVNVMGIQMSDKDNKSASVKEVNK